MVYEKGVCAHVKVVLEESPKTIQIQKHPHMRTIRFRRTQPICSRISDKMTNEYHQNSQKNQVHCRPIEKLRLRSPVKSQNYRHSEKHGLTKMREGSRRRVECSHLTDGAE